MRPLCCPFPSLVPFRSRRPHVAKGVTNLLSSLLITDGDPTIGGLPEESTTLGLYIVYNFERHLYLLLGRFTVRVDFHLLPNNLSESDVSTVAMVARTPSQENIKLFRQ